MPNIWLGIDPGPTESAFCVYNAPTGSIVAEKVPNAQLLGLLSTLAGEGTVMAVEMIACYGMAVGAEVFETAVWIGRFIQAWTPGPHLLVYRREVKLHLCQHPRAKDGNIRQALIDRFGAPGTKKAPGATYGLKADQWQALAVAVTAADREERSK